jgi:hypothetical protein
MVAPARGSAPAPDSGGEVCAPDPRMPCWADVQRALITQACAVALAVTELARHSGSGPALDMARLNLGVMESLTAVVRRLRFDEAIMEQERARAFDEGFAAASSRQRRLSVVSGG